MAIETNLGGIYPGNPRFNELWAELDHRRAVVFVHPTSPPGSEAVSMGHPRPMLEFPFDSARAACDLVLSGVLARYPHIRWIFTHGGGALPLLADRIELFRTVFSGEASAAGAGVPESMSRLWFDMAGTPFPHQVPALVSAFGDDRLLYGSDYCFTPPTGVHAQVDAIDAADQPLDDTWRAITSRNACRLLPQLRQQATTTRRA